MWHLTLSQTSPGFYVSAVQVCWKTLWGKEKLLVTSNFSFPPQCFLPVWWAFFHFHLLWNCRLLALSVWKSLKFVVWEKVNAVSNIISVIPLPHNDDFWCTGGKSLLKTLWEKKKMLIISIFFFSHNISILWKTTLTFRVTLNLSSANAFNLGKCKISSSGKELYCSSLCPYPSFH